MSRAIRKRNELDTQTKDLVSCFGEFDPEFNAGQIETQGYFTFIGLLWYLKWESVRVNGRDRRVLVMVAYKNPNDQAGYFRRETFAVVDLIDYLRRIRSGIQNTTAEYFADNTRDESECKDLWPPAEVLQEDFCPAFDVDGPPTPEALRTKRKEFKNAFSAKYEGWPMPFATYNGRWVNQCISGSTDNYGLWIVDESLVLDFLYRRFR